MFHGLTLVGINRSRVIFSDTSEIITVNMSVSIKSPQEIDKMRVAGRLTGEVLDYIAPFVKAGVTTNELDQLCHDLIVNVQKAIPAPLNYAPSGHRPYPKSICTSINHQVCHGVPGDKALKSGDIVNLDITVIKDGYHGDSSRMFYVGEPSIQARRLCEATWLALWRGIRVVKPGAYLGDIGTVVTKAHSLSAQYEHTILVTDTCFEVLTVSDGCPPPPNP